MKGLTEKSRMVIAGVEIAGGLYGVAAVMPLLVNSEGWLARSLLLPFAAFYATSFAAGMLLIRKRRIGMTLSIYLQYPQLLWVKTSLVTFVLYSGARAGITVPLRLKADLGSAFDVGFGSRPDEGFIGLNILALYCLLLLVEQREILDASVTPAPAPPEPSGTPEGEPQN